MQVCREEFEKSEENPFNQVGIVGFDASKEEMREKREGLRREIEGRLGEEE